MRIQNLPLTRLIHQEIELQVLQHLRCPWGWLMFSGNNFLQRTQVLLIWSPVTKKRFRWNTKGESAGKRMVKKEKCQSPCRKDGKSHFRRENLMLVIFSGIIVLGSIFDLIVVPPTVAYDNHCVASTIILFASLVRSDVDFLLVPFFIYYKNARWHQIKK